MIGWTTISPALISLFGTLGKDSALEVPPVDGVGGTRSFKAEWKEGQRSATHDVQRLSVLIKVTTVVGLGTDDTVYEEVPSDSTDPADAPYLGQLRAVQLGQRKFTLQVQAIVPEHTDAFWAIAATERIRTGLRRPSTIAALDDVDVAIIDILPAIKASFKDNGRVVSCASLDVIFGTSATDIDPIPVGWIETITYSSHISDVDGVELPPSLQVTDFEVTSNNATPDDVQVGDGGLVQDNTSSGVVTVGLPL
jgi:hypothetical protein